MENTYEKIVDIIIAVILLFLFPLLYFGQRQDTITQQVVLAETSDFVDTIRTQGYITKNMYNTYLECISHTHIIGDITLEHKELALEPEYRFKTANEIIGDQNGAWNGSNVYTYVPVTTEVPTVIDPINNDGLTMNSETNESVLAATVDGLSDPSHVHTDECYDGHRHDGGCISSLCNCGGSTGLIEFFDKYNTDNYGATTVTYGYRCTDCKKVIFSTSIVEGRQQYSANFYKIGVYPYYDGETGSGVEAAADIYHQIRGLVMNNSIVHSYTATEFADAFSGTWWYSYGKPYPPMLIIDYHSYLANSCGLLEDTTPICNQIVTSITPTHPTQTLYLNDPLITTATVHYKDGSTKVAVCDADFVPNTVVNNKTVTLSYQGFTSTIKVTVIPKTKVCVNGHTYNLNNDGSDPGCIYCDSWLASLAVTIPASGELTIYQGTTLESNGVVLLGTYLNGRTELLYSGYANNLDPVYVGIQTVTVSYKGKYTTLKVRTKRKLVQCGVCGKYYELYPDGSDPGCPYCAALIPVFTGNVLKYFAESYSNEILKELYEGSGTYYFQEGDYFSIDISNRNKTLGTRLLGITLPNIPQTSIRVEYGGTIRDETQANIN